MKYNIMFNNYCTTGLTSERQEPGLCLFELKHPHTLFDQQLVLPLAVRQCDELEPQVDFATASGSANF